LISEQCAVCYANGHMRWECNQKDKMGDKRRRGSRGSGGKQINVVEDDGESRVEQLADSESESEQDRAKGGKA
jgi:hypothetical protein